MSVTYPALDLAWPGVRVDAERGGAAQAALDEFATALQARDTPAVVAGWPGIHQAAKQGIQAQLDAGDIGPGVADSLAERVIRFEAAILEVAKGGS